MYKTMGDNYCRSNWSSVLRYEFLSALFERIKYLVWLVNGQMEFRVC